MQAAAKCEIMCSRLILALEGGFEMKRKKSFSQEELRYLKLLAQQYPTVQAASSEIINLQAILNLPKGTEHFISDVHGEHEAFLHILNSCSSFSSG